MATASPTIGLIAGQGTLPLLVARGIRAGGARVGCVGLRGQYADELPALCDDFAEAGLLQPGRWVRLLRRFGADRAVMVGRVAKSRMYDPWRFFRYIPDLKAADLWLRRLRHDRRTIAVLAALADELARCGVPLMDSTTFIPDHLAVEGVMTARGPADAQRADIEFGWPLLRRVTELHVGQGMIVRDRDVVAVEAMEGTNRMIERAAELTRGRGWTLLKTAADDHDMRADVPTIGVETIERMAAGGGKCLAVGAGRVILIDRPAVIAAADRLGIAVVGVA